jgi:hypothetical protein
MATKVHNRSEHPRRQRVRRIAKALAGHVLLVLAADAIVTVVTGVGHLLHILPHSGP